MNELVVATTNQGKLREIAAYLDGLVGRVLSLADFPAIGPIIEDGATFQENALIKARTVGRHTGLPTIADDSGLEVAALGGLPGVHSARFAGDHADDQANNEKLLRELDSVPAGKRQAAFHCALVLWYAEDRFQAFDGYLPGEILTASQGAGGFGYDPLFLVTEQGKTLAELPLEVKNSLSHRGQALRQLVAYLAAGA